MRKEAWSGERESSFGDFEAACRSNVCHTQPSHSLLSLLLFSALAVGSLELRKYYFLVSICCIGSAIQNTFKSFSAESLVECLALTLKFKVSNTKSTFEVCIQSLHSESLHVESAFSPNHSVRNRN